MDWSAVMTIAGREARAGLRNRWFILYAVVFLVLSVGFSWGRWPGVGVSPGRRARLGC
ncbi:MAG: hypothetical protein M9890_11580 [Thermomicrobiales bacterium]|nr:hypothetical protein [Thermomicrobiales bacterium]